ncbi:MAG: tetratricopeptide repeat protein [Cyanothece sp. SIO1E1]|nr:tetratricopeptide repeat protein [Cyanothece sp. SIO1E1]
MKYVFSTLLVLMTVIALGQNPVVDSLRHALDTATAVTDKIDFSIDLASNIFGSEPDSAKMLGRFAKGLISEVADPKTRVMAYRKVGLGYHRMRMLDSALVLFQSGLAIAREEKDIKGQAFTLNSMGSLFRTMDRRDEALQHFSEAKEKQEERGDLAEATGSSINIGTIYMERGQYDKAIPYFQEAEVILDSLGNQAYRLISLVNLATCERRRGNNTEALPNYRKALEIAKALENRERESLLLAVIGYVYRDQGNFTKAIESNQEALRIRQEIGNKRLVANSLSNLAQIYHLLQDYEQSTAYLEQVLDTAIVLEDEGLQAATRLKIGKDQKLSGQYDEAIVNVRYALAYRKANGPERQINIPYQYLGSIFLAKGQLDSAYYYLNQSLDFSRKYADAQLQSICLLELGQVDKQKGQLDQAIAKWEEAKKIIPKNTFTKEEAEIAEALYEGYKARNQSGKALVQLERFKLLQDSLFGDANTKALARMELRNEFEQEKQELAFAQEKTLLEKDAQLRRQRSFQWISALALLVAGIFITIILRYYRLRQRANEELQKLNKEILQQKEELEDLSQVKSRFFTNISHELRTPLTIIGGMVDQIRKQPKEWLDKGLAMIDRNNATLLRLVNQILDLRKLESGTLQLDLTHGDIIAYLRYIVESFQSFAESKRIRLHFLDYSKDVEMDYDAEKTLQILSNLLSNAIKFTPEGGEVYLSVNIEEAHTKEENDELLIMVKDTGIGIPADKLPHVFDRFYQVDDTATREGEGTGIGLALTKELVHLMKGDIQVESQVGKGTTFSLNLPIEKAGPSAELAATDQAELATTLVAKEIKALNTSALEEVSGMANGEELDHLLIIEDNADVVEYLQALIGDTYSISVARNGEEGIERAITEIPDVIISDVMMPIKDGFEVCDTLKNDERTSHIPIILLTAKVDTEAKMAGLRRGADAYLAKPFNEEELSVRLQNLLELRQKLKQRYQNLEFSAAEDGETQMSLEDAFITKLRKVIESKLQETDMSIQEVCREMGMSRSQLHKKVKALTNSSTTQIIRSIRLHKAKDLLQNAELTISEVAYDVGFKDPAYFSRSFSEEFGRSPRDFRNEMV